MFAPVKGRPPPPAGPAYDATTAYAVSVSDEGSILLTPLVTIPKRELLVWENEQVRPSLARALAQSAAGETVDLGDFTHYPDRPDDGDVV